MDSGVILAGGDGTRLRSLTRRLAGDDRPKQFCRLLGSETLLEGTRRRAQRLIAPERLLTVVTRAHEKYYGEALAAAPPRTVVVQPENRGTAPAILYALLRLGADAPAGPTAVFPSDHWVSDEGAFMARVEGALEAVRAHPGLVILLGIEPDRPETAYGWIEPAEPIPGGWPWPLYRAGGFWEKPPAAVAQRLLDRGWLWNSFVIVAHPATLDALVRAAVPAVAAAFGPLRARIGTPREDEAARVVYARCAPADLSTDVLQRRSDSLAVLPVTGVAWNDLGEPSRVLATEALVRGQLALA